MTLTETLLYIALLGMLMTSLILSSFTFIEQNSALSGTALKAQDEALLNFHDYE